MRLLYLNQVPIFEQLRLEEALLRTSTENWCLLNTGASPAIVMGISGKPEKLLAVDKVMRDKIPVIKRFSGGGTVYTDPQTIFVTFICNQSDFQIDAQPKAILKWSESVYKPLFKGFAVCENDYVFGDKKFGGNAQYIQKSRWLLHTSFLWDYSPEGMDYLLLPEKRPQYRQARTHSEFLCTLRSTYPCKETLMQTLSEYMQTHFQAHPTSFEEAEHALHTPHRLSTKLVDL